MKIIIITTSNEFMKETGFGKMKACEAVFESLKKRFDDVSISSCTTRVDLKKVIAKRPDIVVLAVKYVQLTGDKKIWLAEYFENAGINHTGSKGETLEYDSNKIKAKKLVLSKDISTADFFVVTSKNRHLKSTITMPYPIFLKPLDAANGNGIDDESIVFNYDDYQKKIDKLFSQYGKIVLAEKYLSGREFTVALIEDAACKKLIVAPIEVIPPQNKDKIRILGEKVKTENTEELRKVDDSIIRIKLIKLATECFRVLGARDFGRIDVKMDEKGICHFIEINLVPGMTKGSSYFPRALEIAKDIGYDDVISLIIDNAIQRNFIDGEYELA